MDLTMWHEITEEQYIIPTNGWDISRIPDILVTVPTHRARRTIMASGKVMGVGSARGTIPDTRVRRPRAHHDEEHSALAQVCCVWHALDCLARLSAPLVVAR